MKILPSSGVDIRNLYGHQIQGVQADVSAARAQQHGASLQDRVDISADARDVEHAQRYAQTLPEVRAEVVASIKEQIAAGEYQMDSYAVADRMLQQAAGLPQ